MCPLCITCPIHITFPREALVGALQQCSLQCILPPYTQFSHDRPWSHSNSDHDKVIIDRLGVLNLIQPKCLGSTSVVFALLQGSQNIVPVEILHVSYRYLDQGDLGPLIESLFVTGVISELSERNNPPTQKKVI